MGKGDRKSRKGKIWRKSYGKYKLRKKRNNLVRKIKIIDSNNMLKIDWDERMQYLNEYLRNGGLEQIFDPLILRGIQEVEFDSEGKVIVNSISSPVKAFTLAIHSTQFDEPLLTKKQVSNYQTLVQKNQFFEQRIIETEDEFDTIFEFYENKKNHLFRGMNEAKYRLVNSIQRNWLWNELDSTDINFKELLEKIIEKAKSNSNGILIKHLESQNIESNNEIAVLSFLQHYSCPTPLLDWTFDFKNALFFSISGIKEPQEQRRIDKYFSIYLIEEKHIIEGSLKELIRGALKEVYDMTKPVMIKKAKELGKYADKALTDKAVEQVALHSYGQRFFNERLLNLDYFLSHPFLYFSDLDSYEYHVSFSLRNNQNVINQKGVFMWNSSPYLPLEHVGKKQAESINPNGNYRFCKCININKSLADYVRSKLNEKGINDEFIYPIENKVEFEKLAKSAFEDVVNEIKK